ncbi:MAG TPA: hypothetical protein VIV60_27680 [Polyangiaceae bacterium]
MKDGSNPVPALVSVGLLATALGTWSSMAEGRFQWRALLAGVLVWGLSLMLGSAALAALVEKANNIDAVFSSVLGCFGLAVMLFLGTVVLHFSVLASFCLCLLLAVCAMYAVRHQRPFQRLVLDPAAIVSLVLAIGFTTLWSRQHLRGLIVTENSVTSIPWFDTYHHAVQIAHFAFASGDLLGRDPLLSAAPLQPYHYAAYMIPSLMVRLGGISAYLATVAVFAPLGTLMTGLTAYCFGRTLVSSLGGLLAMLVCLAVPDATFYLLENRWISYFFFQQIAGNGAMGTALMLLAWTACLRGVREHRRRWTFTGVGLGLCVVIFKSQIFLAYSFGLLLFACATFPRLTKPKQAAMTALATGFTGLCLFEILPRIPHAPTFSFGTTAGPNNLHWTLSKLGGGCQQCIAELAKNFPAFLLVGIPAFLVLAFGILGPLAAALAISGRIRRALQAGGMWFLWTALLNYLIVTLGFKLNDAYGDPYEIIHKTFIWPYLALAVWCGCALAAWVAARGNIVRQGVTQVVLPLVVLLLATRVHSAAAELQTAFVYPGSESSRYVSLPRDAYETARFLREHTPQDAVIQAGVIEGHLLFQSLTDRRMYVDYPPSGRDLSAAAIAAQHYLTASLNAASWNEFRSRATRVGIAYFVLFPGQQPAWTSQTQPVFESGQYRVYAIESAS